jgi:hypothetical protein
MSSMLSKELGSFEARLLRCFKIAGKQPSGIIATELNLLHISNHMFRITKLLSEWPQIDSEGHEQSILMFLSHFRIFLASSRVPIASDGFWQSFVGG